MGQQNIGHEVIEEIWAWNTLSQGLRLFATLFLKWSTCGNHFYHGKQSWSTCGTDAHFMYYFQYLSAYFSSDPFYLKLFEPLCKRIKIYIFDIICKLERRNWIYSCLKEIFFNCKRCEYFSFFTPWLMNWQTFMHILLRLEDLLLESAIIDKHKNVLVC
jgi:hypothetical protein